MVMKDSTYLASQAHERNSFCKHKQVFKHLLTLKELDHKKLSCKVLILKYDLGMSLTKEM